MKKDAELAFYNIEAEDEILGLNNKVGEIAKVEDREAHQVAGHDEHHDHDDEHD